MSDAEPLREDADPSALRELCLRLQARTAAAGGFLPFAEFMAAALYEPGLGYYERVASTVGRRGDFFTSVSVGPVFGELLAAQFDEWLSALGPAAVLVETGAHQGQLARDILTWFRTCRPGRFPSLRYQIVEPSPARQLWQREALAEFADQVHWVDSLGPVEGVIFSNELLDAFPVCPIRWDARAGLWRELGVIWDGSRFREIVQACRPGAPVPEMPPELLAVLPDGFTTERAPAAEAWWGHASRQLQAGWLLTFDYGLEEMDFWVPQRLNGTRRGYRGHRLVADLVEEPGAVDLTAHVHWTGIRQAGEAAGLHTEVLTDQSTFLTRCLHRTLTDPTRFGPWTPPRLRQFQTLTHPQHLGRSFQVLIQSRAIGKSV